jgi:hypothetical protein
MFHSPSETHTGYTEQAKEEQSILPLRKTAQEPRAPSRSQGKPSKERELSWRLRGFPVLGCLKEAPGLRQPLSKSLRGRTSWPAAEGVSPQRQRGCLVLASRMGSTVVATQMQASLAVKKSHPVGPTPEP